MKRNYFIIGAILLLLMFVISCSTPQQEEIVAPVGDPKLLPVTGADLDSTAADSLETVTSQQDVGSTSTGSTVTPLVTPPPASLPPPKLKTRQFMLIDTPTPDLILAENIEAPGLPEFPRRNKAIKITRSLFWFSMMNMAAVKIML